MGNNLITSLTNNSWEDRLRQVLPYESCCATSVCREGLGSGRRPTYITEDDWIELKQHLTIASDFCAFHRRVLFVERLLSVVTKMNWDDHWNSTVQAAALKLVRLNHNRIHNNNNNNVVGENKKKSNNNNNSNSNIIGTSRNNNEDDMDHDTTDDTNNDDADDIIVDCENNNTDSNVIIQPEDAHLLLLG